MIKGGLSLLMAGVCLFSLAQGAPNWVDPMMREQAYPAKDHYIGFVSQSFSKEESPADYSKKVKAAARVALSESIFVSIKSESVSHQSNVNGSSEDRYHKSTVTSSSLDAIGMKVEEYVDERKRVVYAFAYVKRKSLVRHYYGLLSSEMGRIESSLKRILETPDNPDAYLDYNKELNALNQAKEYQDMLKYLEVTSEVVLMSDRWKRAHDATLDALNKLRNKKDIGIKEASYYLVDKLMEELDDDVGTIHMGLITYKSSDVATEFSDYFGNIFRHSLEDRRGGINRSMSQDGYVVSGSYWPGEKEMQVIANINYVRDGEIINLKAGASMAIDIEKVNRLGINYELNKETEDKNNKLIPSSPVGGLIANITTQKGSQSVIFKRGELLELYISVSREAYVRVVNVWSDNKKFLLADNFYVNPELTNQSIKLPLAWETDCPCGVEYIQMVAQDKPFESIEVNNWEGFDLISESLDEMLEVTRGMKENAEYYAESTLILTTME